MILKDKYAWSICPICNGYFRVVNRRRPAIYCSVACKQKGYRQRVGKNVTNFGGLK